MLRAGLVALLLGGLAGSAVAEPVRFAQAEQLNADDVVPEDEAASPNCAADAVDADRGVFGAGEGATQQAAIDAAMKQCRDGGGTKCTLGSVACNPNAPTPRKHGVGR